MMAGEQRNWRQLSDVKLLHISQVCCENTQHKHQLNTPSFRDRLVHAIDSVVPLESTAAYDMKEIIMGVSIPASTL